MKENVIKRCIKIAKTLKNPERCRHFSFLIKKNRILAIGLNKSRKTHPISEKYKTRFSSIHSEIHAISIYKKNDFDYILNIRLDKKSNVRNSKPCIYCQEMLNNLGVKCVYSNDDGTFSVEEYREKVCCS